ncbi:Succinyl-diaminopimelate desuccinylase [Candidatus Bealeia paramacronuclearis]|uniref:Succinyl-diaminopimelate desuccinylase n=1 Tax=Candidatus Bealeia paramacronuclearis TaxID=1921001 RepID=A0ABZ2C558_9PROT|nr:Succinyl-diaminopimelate desuccinylase [Candidatus Bealeia paramacronuclearis]
MTYDPVSLSQELIRCPSITPEEGGALVLLEKVLRNLGFECHRLDYGDVSNLYAKIGTGSPHFCFAGHTDVVPLGDASAWTHDPFSGQISEGKLWGRGTADMKCAIAAFVVAVERFLSQNAFQGSLSFLITGDEEKDAIHGTVKVLEWLKNRNDFPDACLIGEPTSQVQICDMIKIGRRGSVTGKLTCHGKQGHIAYPAFMDNPIPRLLKTLQVLLENPIDAGSDYFEPSRLEITSIDVGNKASNIIPNKVTAYFGVRINDLQTGEKIQTWIEDVCRETAGHHDLEITCHGDAFLTQDQDLIKLVSLAVQNVTGRVPELSTSGATTDGRFITHHCPVVECGLKEATMHQIDEHVEVGDIEILTAIYERILGQFFRQM